MSRIDIDSLLQAVSADEPGGPDLEYDAAFLALEELAKGKEPRQIGDTVVEAEPPNWPQVLGQSQDLLGRSKDLRLAMHLVRAALVIEGWSGFTSGLSAVEGLLGRFWETLHPQLDPDDGNDPTGRVNILSALCDPDTILRSLRESPLVSAKGLGQFSLRDYDIATGKSPASADVSPVPLTTIEAAFLDVEPEQLRATADALKRAVNAVQHIETLLTEKAGIHHAMNMNALGDVLKSAQQIVREYLTRRFPDEVAEDAESGGDAAEGGGRAQRLSGSINSREDVMRALDKVCEYLNKYEPTSPAQLFIDCAKRLMTTNFIDSVKILGTDGVALLDKIRNESG